MVPSRKASRTAGAVGGSSFVNYGTITTTVQDPKNKVANLTQINSMLKNKQGGTVADESGLLEVNSVFNSGTISVAPRAPLDLVASSPGGLPSGVFTNSGTIRNGGTISAQGGTWSQLAGQVVGHAVVLQDGTTLVDPAGQSKFVVNAANATLTGTVPKGQTITVVARFTTTRAKTTT